MLNDRFVFHVKHSYCQSDNIAVLIVHMHLAIVSVDRFNGACMTLVALSNGIESRECMRVPSYA